MEDELRCPSCSRFYTKPVLLPCSHSLCLGCATSAQVPAQQIIPTSEECTTGISELDLTDVDKVSILSETDSGVVCNSRPNSYVGTPCMSNMIIHAVQGNAIAIPCPACKKVAYLDESGANSLPKNRVLEVIIDKYSSSKNLSISCQLCEKDAREASVMCEQCEVFYCDTCRDSCHPLRGPLAKHNLVTPTTGREIVRAKNKTNSKEVKCTEHGDENISMYCMMCKVPVCYLCLQDGRHTNHDVQALGAICKAQKVGPSPHF